MYYFNDVLTHTWTINPTTVNTVSVFWNEQSAHNQAAVLDSNNKAMCLSRYINVTELPGQCFMEGFTVTGESNNIQGGWTEPSQEVRNTYGFTDSSHQDHRPAYHYGGHRSDAPVCGGVHAVSRRSPR